MSFSSISVCVLGAHALQQIRAGAEVEMEGDVRQGPAQGLEGRPHPGHPELVAGPDHDLLRYRPFFPPSHAKTRRQLGERALRRGEEVDARLRQGHPTPEALEERTPRLILESRDALPDGGRREADRARGGLEARRSRGLDEAAERIGVGEIHSAKIKDCFTGV
jgi:hypothetical protein